jgi:hypothetical protein
MPNWCNNYLELTHEDPVMITRAIDAIKRGELLEEFIPVPLSLKETIAGSYGDPELQAKLEASQQENLNNHNYKDWYDFCVNEWGTKWDISETEPNEYTEISMTCSFDTAWAPPIAAMQKFIDLGFNVRLYYYEPGMAFAGIFDNGDDDCYEYGGMNSVEIAQSLPQDLDDMFGISDQAAEWEAEQEEENDD